MRRLDRVLGDATCSVLATAHRFRKPIGTRPVRKIAVMKFFGMGSIIVASRSLAALRECYPGAEIHFVTFQSNQAILDILTMTDRNHYVDPSTPQSFLKTTLAVAAALRREHIDLALDLEFFAKFPLVLSSLAGIPQKAGFYLTSEGWRRELLDVTGFYNSYFHTSDIFLSLVYLCATGDHYYLEFNDWAAKYKYPRIEPGDLERAQLRGKLAGHGIGRTDPVYVINANTSPDLAPEARKWPKERYAQLADELVTYTPSARVCFIGAPNERAYVNSVAALCKTPRRHVLAGDLSLRELLVLFAEAKLVVSNDSGPMHLADAVDCPQVVLFSGTDLESQWRPRRAPTRLLRRATPCAPCYLFDCPIGLPCLDIPPEEVVGHVLDLLPLGDRSGGVCVGSES
ncbi:MAG TPA: glycosyltransferase family 9 protein [Kofleriaceae bacterium]|nr:glycosyltransferase family 9 protein [Kofleriaceae bacterium]